MSDFKTGEERPVRVALQKDGPLLSRVSAKSVGSVKSVDSMMSAAPLGGAQTAKNPTDRSNWVAKFMYWLNERGCSLAIYITDANDTTNGGG
jgi:hypothetical protein